jgi:nucleoside-triphosphatase
MKVVIAGVVGSGKSTLIQRLAAAIPMKPRGFTTGRSPADGSGQATVHITRFGGDKLFITENQIGVCSLENGAGLPEGFEKAGIPLLAGLPPKSFVIMDEIGFMESCSPAFCRAVLDILEGDHQVLAAVSSKDTPFLRLVRTHPEVKVYEINEHNRDGLFEQILDDFRQETQLDVCHKQG